jgi:hypothetical protein
LIKSVKANKLKFIIFFFPLILTNTAFLNMGLAADDFWRLPWANQITLRNLVPETLNWIPGRNLQVVWVKLATSIFGVENDDIYKYHLLGVLLLGALAVSFFIFMQKILHQRISIIVATFLFILWPTHSETTFWIEQSIQVQVPLLCLILWLSLNHSFFIEKSLAPIRFILIELILIVIVFFTYDQAGFLLFYLNIIRIFWLIYYFRNFKILRITVPSIAISVIWFLQMIGSRNGGPELREFDNQKIESFFGLWFHSYYINSRVFESRFQPYSLYGYWPWPTTTFLILLLLVIFFAILLFRKLSSVEFGTGSRSETYLESKNRNFLIFVFYTGVLVLYSSFIFIAATFYRDEYFFNGSPSPSTIYASIGIFLFILANLFIDYGQKNNLGDYRNYLYVRILLLVTFFVSYFPVYLWSISPRHNLIPSFIICVFIGYIIQNLFNLKGFTLPLKGIFALLLSIYLSLLSINFLYSAKAYSQSWLLKETLYQDLYMQIRSIEYEVGKSCWIIENPPQSFMGYPLFIYESPQLGLNYYYKLPDVNFCDSSKNLSDFNKLVLDFVDKSGNYSKFEYEFSIEFGNN